MQNISRGASLPEYAAPLFEHGKWRYKVLYGGRGSGKSYSAARALLILGAQRPIRVLCAREFQNSITESVHFLLRQEISSLGLDANYTVTNSSIIGKNGTEFIFKGIRMNIDSIKSMAGITHVWIEEAHTISKLSWDILIPTIREPDSEIWVTFNPSQEDDPTYTMFVGKDGNPLDRDDAYIAKVNWDQNPWFPDVLKKEKDYLYKVNPELAEHVWGGRCRSHSDAQIFRGKWSVADFDISPTWDGPYYGADFGFSNDPSTLLEIYLDVPNHKVMIRRASFRHRMEIDHMPAWYESFPGIRNHVIRGDSARPETISFLNRHGFHVEAAEKWTGSVEDGVEWLRSWTIVIHTEAAEDGIDPVTQQKYGMKTEAMNYSYKVDRLTQDVLTDIVDSYNHGWDAVRYGLDPIIRSGNISILDVI